MATPAPRDCDHGADGGGVHDECADEHRLVGRHRRGGTGAPTRRRTADPDGPSRSGRTGRRGPGAGRGRDDHLVQRVVGGGVEVAELGGGRAPPAPTRSGSSASLDQQPREDGRASRAVGAAAVRPGGLGRSWSRREEREGERGRWRAGRMRSRRRAGTPGDGSRAGVAGVGADVPGESQSGEDRQRRDPEREHHPAVVAAVDRPHLASERGDGHEERDPGAVPGEQGAFRRQSVVVLVERGRPQSLVLERAEDHGDHRHHSDPDREHQRHRGAGARLAPPQRPLVLRQKR